MSLHFRESGVTLNGGVDFDSGLTSEPIAGSCLLPLPISNGY